MEHSTVPVSDDRTDLAGSPPLWTKPSLYPPYSWGSWFGQFSLALGIKDNFSVSDILVEPGDVHDDALPRPETRSDPEIQPEADDRLRRYAAAKNPSTKQTMKDEKRDRESE